MKCKVVLLNITFIAVMVFCFTVCACAESISQDEIYDNFDIELDSEVKNILSDFGFDDFSAEEISNISVFDTFYALLDIFKGSMSKPFSCFCSLLAIILLCASASSFLNNSGAFFQYYDSVITLFVSLYAFANTAECIADCVASIYSTGILMKSLIPATAALAAFSGNPTIAVSYNSVAMYCAEIITAVCRDFLTPVLCSFSAVAVCAGVNQSFNIEPILNSVKKFVSIVLGLAGTVFTGIMALKDVLAVGIDKVAVKGVKFVLGSAVPVVGSSLSEGLSSVIASVSLMKNTYGAIGIIVIIVVTMPSVCQLILWQLTFSATSYAAQSLGLTGAYKALSSLKYVTSMLLSILLFTVYILIVTSALIMLLGNKG